MRYEPEAWWVGVAIAVVAGFIGGAVYLSMASDPCAEWVTGYINAKDDKGRSATIEHTWCETWKPGRGPEAGAP